jgi:hypothetical protein
MSTEKEVGSSFYTNISTSYLFELEVSLDYNLRIIEKNNYRNMFDFGLKGIHYSPRGKCINAAEGDVVFNDLLIVGKAVTSLALDWRRVA